MLERIQNKFFLTFLPEGFYIGDSYSRNKMFEMFEEEWFFFYAIIIISLIIICKKIDGLVKKYINMPNLISIFYGLIVMIITNIFYILHGSHSDFHLMIKLFIIAIIAAMLCFFTNSKVIQEASSSSKDK